MVRCRSPRVTPRISTHLMQRLASFRSAKSFHQSIHILSSSRAIKRSAYLDYLIENDPPGCHWRDDYAQWKSRLYLGTEICNPCHVPRVIHAKHVMWYLETPGRTRVIRKLQSEPQWSSCSRNDFFFVPSAIPCRGLLSWQRRWKGSLQIRDLCLNPRNLPWIPIPQLYSFGL
jgi:hypothetical protein